MVYDWDDKEELCYRMYIDEKKSLEEIMEFMKETMSFNPSKRAFQTQFKKWEFPSKQNPAHRNEPLVQRVKELWDINTSQREMLRILNEEGFEIKERELMRVRAKNRWLLRVPNGNKSKKLMDQDVENQLQQAFYNNGQLLEGEQQMEGQMEDLPPTSSTPKNNSRAESPPLSPEVMAKRQERYAKLQAESAERWAARKRRRRTRGWAGLPADPPGPPRFPSETTIDESKSFLSLDNRLYRDIRERFQRICEEAGIIKKTIAGPERWEAAKDRLIQESEHLQSVFWNNDDNLDPKKLALDVVCGDVTKRMRTLQRRMTIAEAKNALGVNPEESRQLRNAFYQTLKADHFTSKLEAGEEHWQELKASWINGSELLQNLLAPGEADPQHGQKVKAMEVLCRDVMKRLRDDQTKRDPTRRKKFDSTFQPGQTMEQFHHNQEGAPNFQPDPQEALIQTAAHAHAHSQNQAQSHMQAQESHMQAQARQAQAQAQAHAHAQSQAQAQVQPQPQAHTPVMVNHGDIQNHGDMQIDPSLLLAAANDPGLMNRSMQNQFAHPQYTDQQYVDQAAQAFPSAAPSSMIAYFRLHPASDVTAPSRLWMDTLNGTSLEELRRLAASKFPGAITGRVEGIMLGPSDQDLTIPIDNDSELDAYLGAIGGVKPSFSVQLFNAWKNA
ncbi:46038ceb-6a98-4a66-b03b-fe2bf54578c7 [Sclerotinia trifoliorum]|uniref:46038ceb-6a98-4a66-b03b-fe2bf54578c7 n=1 Tax=Sclerotinia trifoliorum TaxID=28548 RepID=A0A8H2ZPP7_9HELO|nr:46038ceb-6a98-4a66-b03b-fe2bf54578c7 [Sclerotinia trifoliorum]